MRQPKRRLSWAGVPIDRRRVLLGLAAAGGFLAVDLGAVLYAGGWPAGERLTPQGFMDAFKRVNGSHPGFRRNHAKGVAVAGYFDSTGAGQEFSKAAVFRPGQTSVVGRFSLAGGNPNVADMIDTPRGLALAFGYPGDQQWRTAMLNLPVFLDSSPQGFYDRLVASKIAPGTGKPDPEAMASFLAAHPETKRAMALIKEQPPTSGFGNSIFRSLNAFYFVNNSGARTAVRWSLAPMDQASPPIQPSSGTERPLRRSDPANWFETAAMEVARNAGCTDGPGQRCDCCVADRSPRNRCWHSNSHVDPDRTGGECPGYKF